MYREIKLFHIENEILTQFPNITQMELFSIKNIISLPLTIIIKYSIFIIKNINQQSAGRITIFIQCEIIFFHITKYDIL